MKIRIGITEIIKKNRRYVYTYKDIKEEEDEEGWVDASIYLPLEYDLCCLMLENEKIISGWWTGCGWDGRKISENDKVLFWKRKQE